MPDARRRERGRGERVLPGVFRLRLPLPWPGVPHGNAWALRAGDGIVLVDTGMSEPGSLGELELALDQVGLALGDVRLVVCTHAHADHYGQAGPVTARANDGAGCELWMHPNHAHIRAAVEDPGAALARRLEVARQSGVPEEPLRAWAERRGAESSGVAELRLPDRPLVTGVVVESDLGPWRAIETPGHAPSHVCLHQPERRVLISGDHVLGRVSLYYDYGYTPDPAGEFLASLDAVEALDARLGLSGHGKPFVDVRGHIRASRAAVHEQLAACRAALADGPRTAYEVVARLHGEPPSAMAVSWWMSQALCHLRHLEVRGEVRRERGGSAERWALA